MCYPGLTNEQDSMSKATIYHNPRCSKSRATLALLEQHKIPTEIIKYLDTPPEAETLMALTKLLGMPMNNMLRTKEADYKTAGFEQAKSDEELAALLHRFPKVLERPIIVYQNKAVIGRPPENVLEIIS